MEVLYASFLEGRENVLGRNGSFFRVGTGKRVKGTGDTSQQIESYKKQI